MKESCRLAWQPGDGNPVPYLMELYSLRDCSLSQCGLLRGGLYLQKREQELWKKAILMGIRSQNNVPAGQVKTGRLMPSKKAIRASRDDRWVTNLAVIVGTIQVLRI